VSLWLFAKKYKFYSSALASSLHLQIEAVVSHWTVFPVVQLNVSRFRCQDSRCLDALATKGLHFNGKFETLKKILLAALVYNMSRLHIFQACVRIPMYVCIHISAASLIHCTCEHVDWRPLLIAAMLHIKSVLRLSMLCKCRKSFMTSCWQTQSLHQEYACNWFICSKIAQFEPFRNETSPEICTYVHRCCLKTIIVCLTARIKISGT
jgi:hypothetical protein